MADNSTATTTTTLISDRPVILITGCSSGLGQALAIQLHAANFQVIATARRLEALDALAALGIKCLALDVTDDIIVRRAVRKVMDTEGRLDVLINNAGLSILGPIAEQPLAQVQKVLDTNLIGVIRVTQAVVPHMAARGRGLILNIGSVVSQMTTPWTAAYSASKAALLAVTDALRLELIPFGIGVSYVIAGAMKSAFGDNIVAAADFSIYETDTSLYRNWVSSLKSRAHLSQGGAAVTAEKAADDITKVIIKSLRQPTPNPPCSFFVGGNARLYWLVGLIQKTLGWTNALLAKRFGLVAAKRVLPDTAIEM